MQKAFATALSPGAPAACQAGTGPGAATLHLRQFCLWKPAWRQRCDVGDGGWLPFMEVKCGAASPTLALRGHPVVVCGSRGLCPRPTRLQGLDTGSLTPAMENCHGVQPEPVVEQFQHTRHHVTVGKPHYQSRRGG